MWKSYYTPICLEEALRLLSEQGGEARIVAGATDLLLELEQGQKPAAHVLIDVTRIPELDQIYMDENGWIHIGPLVTHNKCLGSPLIQQHAFCLARACWEVGSPQIRNRGTIAGNLITASPANDTIPPLMALGARVKLRSIDGEREFPLRDFYRGVRQTVLEEHELLTDISFPAAETATRSTFHKLALRQAQAISVANVAVVLEMEEAKVRSAQITLGSVAPTVVHAKEAEAALLNQQLTQKTIQRAAELACKATQPIDDIRGSAAYRLEMVEVITRRALQTLAQGKERQGFPDRPVLLQRPDSNQRRDTLSTTLNHLKGTPIETSVNGEHYVVDSGQEKTLLRFLREDLGMTGTKEGCAEGECGSCTVILDGMAVLSCLVPAPRAHGAEILTIEGLSDNGSLHPLQQAFVEEGAVQCGYCTPGFIMSGSVLLEELDKPSRLEIQQALAGNLCRCTGYYKIITAVEKACSASR